MHVAWQTNLFCNIQAHGLRTEDMWGSTWTDSRKTAPFFLAGGGRCPEGSQRTKARRPGRAGSWGQAKASFGSCWAPVTKFCKPAALDFGISLFLSPHQRMFQCLCLHNNLGLFSWSPLKSQSAQTRTPDPHPMKKTQWHMVLGFFDSHHCKVAAL